jgi:hypothetical protein
MRIAQPGIIALDACGALSGVKPSVDGLFETAAAVYGKRVIGVVLSGGGSHDGTSGSGRKENDVPLNMSFLVEIRLRRSEDVMRRDAVVVVEELWRPKTPHSEEKLALSTDYRRLDLTLTESKSVRHELRGALLMSRKRHAPIPRRQFGTS